MFNLQSNGNNFSYTKWLIERALEPVVEIVIFLCQLKKKTYTIP